MTLKTLTLLLPMGVVLFAGAAPAIAGDHGRQALSQRLDRIEAHLDRRDVHRSTQRHDVRRQRIFDRLDRIENRLDRRDARAFSRYRARNGVFLARNAYRLRKWELRRLRHLQRRYQRHHPYGYRR